MRARRVTATNIALVLAAGLVWGGIQYTHRQASAEAAEEITRDLFADTIPSGDATTRPTTSTLLGLDVGDCLLDPADLRAVGSVPTVSCDRPHRYEVVATVPHADGGYPGDEALRRVATRACEVALVGYAGSRGAAGLEPVAVWPSARSWDQLDDRVSTCFAREAAGRLTTGSVGLAS